MFKDMMMQIRADIVFHIFHLNLDMFDEHEIEERRERELEELNMIGGDETSTKQAARAVNKVGRNDPCPCGSGKKYKKCCGA